MGTGDYYDLHVPGPNHYALAGVWHHNCGKTLGFCDYFHRMALQYPGMVQLWTRRHRKDLNDSVLKTFETEVLPATGLNILQLGSTRENRNSYLYPNGSEVIIQGIRSDTGQKQRSVQADVIWVNEPTELTEDEWEELGGSVRESMNPACPYRFKIGDINPMPPGHWTNTRSKPFPEHLYPPIPDHDDGAGMPKYLTPDMYQEIQEYNLEELRRPYKTKMIVFCAADNPGYWSIDPWGWKRPGLKYAVGQLGKMSGHKRARYLAGRPMAAQGVVFPEFRRDKNGIPWHMIEPFEIPREWPCVVMKDPGRDHPDVTLLMAVSPFFIEFKDASGKPYRMHKKYFVEEWVTGNESDYGRPSTTAEDAAVLDEWDKRYRIVLKLGDPHYMFSETKHSVDGKSICDQMAGFGHIFEPAPAAGNEAEIAEQCELIRTGLVTLDKLGRPMIQCFSRCLRLINVGFESWGYRRNARGEIMTGDDKFEKLGDDEIDAARQGVTVNPQFADYSHLARRKVLYNRGPL